MTEEMETRTCLVVSLNDADELRQVEVPLVQPRGGGGAYVYAQVPQYFTIEYLDFELDRLLKSRTDDAETVVIRCHQDAADRLRRDQEMRAQLTRRFPYAEVMLLRWSRQKRMHVLEDLESGTDLTSSHAGHLTTAMSIDFESGLLEPGAVLPPNPEFHYEGPNGLHYESFIRAGYGFQSIDSIHAAAFWLIPHFRDVDVLVLDSWTMLGFGHAVVDYILNETPTILQKAPRIESATRYAEDSHLRSRLQRHSDLGTATRALVLTSVHSTGATEKLLVQACKDAGFNVHRVLRLYSNPSERTESRVVTLHELREPIRSTPSGKCDSCLVERKSLVPVDPRSLLLALTAAVEETRITRDVAAPAHEFLGKYAEVKPFSLHRTDPGGDRHHMIYVDVVRLLTSQTFVDKARTLAAQLRGQVDLVVSPEHDAAVQLAELVATELAVPRIACEQRAFVNLTGDNRDRLRAAKTILFVDDVMITGSRLRRVKHELMHSRIITDEREVTIRAFVGVARPASASAWTGQSDMVGRTNVTHVEYLELPNWDTMECPWCSELALLSEYMNTHQSTPLLRDRRDRLSDVRVGVNDRLFLTSKANAGGSILEPRRVGEDKFEAAEGRLRMDYKVTKNYAFSELGQGSIFGQLEEVELFVAVAAALQRLRNSRRLSERPQYPLARILDPHLYFLGRFYANIIVAAILRSARRRDIRTVDIEAVLRQATGLRLAEPESRELHLELLLAIAQTKLPLPNEAGDPSIHRQLDNDVADFAWWIAQRGPAART